MDNQLFVVLHKIDGLWYPGEPTTLEKARTVRSGLQAKWPKDQIEIQLYATYQLKKQNGDYDTK